MSAIISLSDLYIETCLCIIDLQSKRINFKATYTTLSHMGCKLCIHQCECVGTKNSSFTEEQVSLYLRIAVLQGDTLRKS